MRRSTSFMLALVVAACGRAPGAPVANGVSAPSAREQAPHTARSSADAQRSPYVAALEAKLPPGSVLSLSSELQSAAEAALAATGRAGAVVAFDPRDGRVRALFSVVGERGDPLLTPHQPGSTFKSFMTVAALRAGVLAPDTVLTCTGAYDFAGAHLTCPLQHGAENPVRALAVSCNSFYYQLATKLDPARVVEVTRELGWDQRTGIELADAPGVIPEPPAKDAKPTPRPLVDAVGHGQYQVTLLGLARAYAAFANGGNVVDLHVVDAQRGSDGTLVPVAHRPPRPTGLEPAAITLVLEGLRDAIATPDGRAHALAIPGYPFYGKTGSVEAPSRVGAPVDAPEEDDSWFVAFAPLPNPLLVVATRVERARGKAGQVARQVLEAFRANGAQSFR
jgi:cell division protein FtsI/penicillin-binding protein 2